MDRYAVVGNPVAHSLSPRIHGLFAAATGQRLRYDTLLAPLDDFAGTVAAFFAAGGRGLNVTVPFKEQAAAWVTELEPAAAAAGAVNTIVRLPTGYRGCNTDGAGLVRDLTVNCTLALRGRRLLLLGAGGAARGVVRPLLVERPAELVIANRTARRALTLAAALRSAAVEAGSAMRGCGLEDLSGGFDVVINATSGGLGTDPVEELVDPVVVRGAFCYDLMYARDGSAATAFCRWATAHGAPATTDGLGMLVEQAALAFELWRGVAPATRPVLELLRGGAV